MGVSGCGKSTIGKMLGERLEIPFFDGDDFHPQTNIDKMANGFPLNDTDRKPWLENLANHIKDWEKDKGAIVACSALKESYRQILSSKVTQVNWVFLEGSFELIFNRMKQRKGHFMKAELLQSQFDTLEIPTDGLFINIDKRVEAIVEEVIRKVNRRISNDEV
jgi:carbohydrate kinase (thermoresistant glucokinase family)